MAKTVSLRARSLRSRVLIGIEVEGMGARCPHCPVLSSGQTGLCRFDGTDLCSFIRRLDEMAADEERDQQRREDIIPLALLVGEILN